jgi:phosphate transport system substrate-binding protein
MPYQLRFGDRWRLAARDSHRRWPCLDRHAARAYLLSLLAGLTAALLAACSNRPAAAPTPISLRVTGSTSLSLVLEELAQAYQAEHPNVLVDIRSVGSTVGLEALGKGQADLAAISWRAADEKLPDGMQAVPIARDGIAIAVHPRNTIPGLTLLQLRALFRGETSDWSALKGASSETVIVSREDGSGTRTAFETLAMGGDRVSLNALVMPTSQAVVDYVASHRGAVGYVSTGALTDDVRAVPVEDVAPTASAVRSGVYNLGRVLYLYAPNPTPPATQAFLDFILSPAGQAMVARHLVPIR